MNPGTYQVINADGVKIRKSPEIIENKIASNQIGLLKFGTIRHISNFATDKTNATWGQVTEPDAAGIAGWVCVKNINRAFLTLLQADPAPSPLNPAELLQRIDKLEAYVGEIEKRIATLEGAKTVLPRAKVNK